MLMRKRIWFLKIRNMTYIQPDQDPKYFNKIIRYSRISWAFLRKLSVQTIGRIWRNNFDPDVCGSQHWFPEMNKLFDPQGSQSSVMRPPRSQLLHRWGGNWWRGITVFYNNTGIHLHWSELKLYLFFFILPASPYTYTLQYRYFKSY